MMRAAFFDLDKTVIAKASIPAFGRPLYRGGLINRRLVARALKRHGTSHLFESGQPQRNRMQSDRQLYPRWRRFSGWSAVHKNFRALRHRVHLRPRYAPVRPGAQLQREFRLRVVLDLHGGAIGIVTL